LQDGSLAKEVGLLSLFIVIMQIARKWSNPDVSVEQYNVQVMAY